MEGLIYYIEIFNNLDINCINNIIDDNIDNLNLIDLSTVYLNFKISNTQYLSSKLIVSDNIDKLLTVLNKADLIKFEYDYNKMKLFIIYFLFYYSKNNMDLENLLMLYISVHKCVYRKFAETLINTISEEQIQKSSKFIEAHLDGVQIKYLNNGLLENKMYGGAFAALGALGLARVFGTSLATIATIYMGDEILGNPEPAVIAFPDRALDEIDIIANQITQIISDRRTIVIHKSNIKEWILSESTTYINTIRMMIKTKSLHEKLCDLVLFRTQGHNVIKPRVALPQHETETLDQQISSPPTESALEKRLVEAVASAWVDTKVWGLFLYRLVVLCVYWFLVLHLMRVRYAVP